MKTKTEDNNIIFIPEGEITLKNGEIIKKDIIDTLQKSSGYQKVYIDMKNVSFLDSSGIGMLIYINRFLHSRQKMLHLTSASPEVYEVLKLGAFDKLFKIEKQ
ncbi:MAG: STAS domain-containing protein [Spirochaetes bacterium]|nr:STAS domain-containing protein [Spirochaetota bacterium]